MAYSRSVEDHLLDACSLLDTQPLRVVPTMDGPREHVYHRPHVPDIRTHRASSWGPIGKRVLLRAGRYLLLGLALGSVWAISALMLLLVFTFLFSMLQPS